MTKVIYSNTLRKAEFPWRIQARWTAGEQGGVNREGATRNQHVFISSRLFHVYLLVDRVASCQWQVLACRVVGGVKGR